MDFSKLGKTIKQIRLDKNLSIKELADDVGVSSSLLSQIERGLANPSLNTLREISISLDVPMFSLFIDDKLKHAMVVRKSERIRIHAGENNSSEIELGYDLLSPDMKGAIQMCEMVLGPNMINSDKFNSHEAEEVAVCTEGQIELILENKSIILDKGDSVRIEKGTLHKWSNPKNEKCSVIFALTPPLF